MRRVKRYWKVALIGGAAALAFLVVAPVFGSSHPNADHLRMTEYEEEGFEDYFGFFYPNGTDPSDALPSDRQSFSFGKGCVINGVTDPLVKITSPEPNGAKGAGVHNLSLGVKTGGSNGTPCSETSDPEVLAISAEDGQYWSRLRLDTQPKQDAWVLVTLSDGNGFTETHQLLTGGAIGAYNAEAAPGLVEPLRDSTLPYEAYTGIPDPRGPAGTDLLSIEACANPSDSGPDSGINDNCIWHIVASSPFNLVEITTLPDWGSVALEGGSDYAGWDAATEGMDGGTWDSLFYRALSATDDAYTVDEDDILNVGADGVLSNDSLPPGTPSLILVDDGDGAGATSGSVVLHPSNGSFTYTPESNFNGSDVFWYQVTVGGQSAVAVVNITVDPTNDPPTGNDGPVLPPVDEDDPATGYAAEDLATDIDVGDTLTISEISADNGDVEVTGEGSTFTYEPDPDFCGTDTITFTVQDQDGATTDYPNPGDQQTITIEVICINDAPVAGDDSYEFHERGAPTFTNPLMSTVPTGNTPPDPVDLLFNDSDVDLPADDVDQGYIEVVGNTQPTHPTLALSGDVLTVNSDGSFSYTPDLLPANDPGTPGVIDSWEELGAFSYTVTWDYTVSDDVATDTGTVSMEIIRVICSEETVRDDEGTVTGAFTLLKNDGQDPKCKPYSVVANESANAVDFIPEADGGGLELFRGLLSFSPEQQADGEYTLGLSYDPFFDPDDPSYVVQWIELPQCVDPVYELGGIDGFPGFPPGYQAMLVVDADFTALPLIPDTSIQHTWCWAGDITLPGGGSEVNSIRQVIGLQDPRFGGSGFK